MTFEREKGIHKKRKHDEKEFNTVKKAQMKKFMKEWRRVKLKGKMVKTANPT